MSYLLDTNVVFALMKQHSRILLSSLYTSDVIPAGKRVSSAKDGELKFVHVSWIPAIPAGMTGLNTLVYNDETCSQLKQVDTTHF